MQPPLARVRKVRPPNTRDSTEIQKWMATAQKQHGRCMMTMRLHNFNGVGME